MLDLNFHETLGNYISKANWHMRTYFTKLIQSSGVPVTIEQWVILNIVHLGPGMSQAEIATKVIKDKTNVTRILEI